MDIGKGRAECASNHTGRAGYQHSHLPLQICVHVWLRANAPLDTDLVVPVTLNPRSICGKLRPCIDVVETCIDGRWTKAGI